MSQVVSHRDNHLAPTDAVSRRMSRTGPRDTSAEIRLRRSLYGLGLRYRVNYIVSKRPRRTADVVFTRARLAVFVDGCFWHGCPEHASWPKKNAGFWKNKIETNRMRDRDTDKLLKEKGWEVVRIWEHEDTEEAAKRIASLYYSRVG